MLFTCHTHSLGLAQEPRLFSLLPFAGTAVVAFRVWGRGVKLASWADFAQDTLSVGLSLLMLAAWPTCVALEAAFAGPSPAVAAVCLTLEAAFAGPSPAVAAVCLKKQDLG